MQLPFLQFLQLHILLPCRIQKAIVLALNSLQSKRQAYRTVAVFSNLKLGIGKGGTVEKWGSFSEKLYFSFLAFDFMNNLDACESLIISSIAKRGDHGDSPGAKLGGSTKKQQPLCCHLSCQQPSY